MEKPKSTSEDDEIVVLFNKWDVLYREAQLSQKEDNLPVKSNVVAEPLRVKGDKHFATGSFDEARRFYTTFLACAEEDNEAIGTVYANRSAALFKLGYFEQCILDIDRAMNSNYPKDKKKSLRERKEQALKKAKQCPPLASSRTSEVEAEWRDKLCHFHNPHIPGASNKIKFENNKSWGTHLVATENINAGEILTSQKFFTMVNSEDMETEYGDIYHQVCSNCLLYNPALIPCPTCCLAMYCSEHCRTEAFNSYHRIECRVFRTKDVNENIVALRCLLVGTDQGAGLASLMRKIELPDVFDIEAKIDESTEKPFSNDYTFLLWLYSNLLKPLSDRVDFIPKIIIALRKAGYFDDNNPDLLQHEASIDPKAVGYNNSKSERDVDCNETDKDITSELLDSVKPANESDDRKKDPDEGKNEDRPIVQEHAHYSAIVNTSSKNANEQREAHIDAKDRNNGESVFEKDGDISSEVLQSIEVVDESVDKEEDPDVGKNEDRQIVREHEDFSKIVGIEFIKEVTCHYCELCNLCLCYNPEISQDEIILAHRRTPLHIERCSAKNLEQEITTQECVTETSPSQNVILDTMSKKPQLDTSSKRRSRKKKTEARSKSASDAKSDDTNEQNKLEKSATNLSRLENVTLMATMAEQPRLSSTSQPESSSTVIHTEPPDSLPGSSDANEQNVRERQREAHIDAKDGNNDELVYEKDGDISSKILDSVEIANETLDKKEDPDVGKNEDRPIVQVEHEDSSRIVDGKETIKEVSSYYCELCNLCLCYKQEMSKYEVLLAHCSTPLHLKRFSLKTTEEKDVNTQEFVTETSVPKEAEEPPLDSTSKPPESSTEISTSPLYSLPASDDANEQKLLERQGFALVKETTLFKNVNLYGADVAKPGPSTATPQQDTYSVDSNANQHQKQSMTNMELFASLLLLNHIQAIEYVTFGLRKFGDNYSSQTVYGYGVCMLHAMINHSCDPNVDFVIRGQEMAMYALKPISKGEQIFITYVGSFACQSLQKRQELLMSDPLIVNCECVACVNKWPMFNDLIQMRPKFLVSSKKAGIKAIQKIMSPLSGKTADSMSRLEIIQVISRLRDWLHTNVERPYAISVKCEQLLIRVVKYFYDTSSLLMEVTEFRKNDILDCISNIVSSIRIDLQHLVT